MEAGRVGGEGMNDPGKLQVVLTIERVPGTQDRFQLAADADIDPILPAERLLPPTEYNRFGLYATIASVVREALDAKGWR